MPFVVDPEYSISTGEAPAELLDLAHPVWRDPLLFGKWCRRQGIAEPDAGDDWSQRFRQARRLWAFAHGWTKLTGDAEASRQVDEGRLQAAHVPYCGAPVRMLARAEAAAPDAAAFRASRSQPYGRAVDRYPSWAVGMPSGMPSRPA